MRLRWCTVTAIVTNTASTRAPTTVIGGQVTATMTATVSIDGVPAGGCTQVGSLPLNGTGSISCSDPEAGSIFNEANAIAKAKARATATPGSTYTWTVYSYAPVEVLARAQVNVEKLINDLKHERQHAVCSVHTAGRGQVSGDSARTKVFRVEGPGNTRLDISGSGDVSIKGDAMLFLDFGDEARAQEFLAQRLVQEKEGTVIKSFDVPTSYVDVLRARAMPESMAKQPGASVISVDTTKTASSFGLRSSELPGLQRAIILGSGC